jgi:P27 family predicted phage terminase small subunit
MTAKKSAATKALHGTTRRDRAPPQQAPGAQPTASQQPVAPAYLSEDAQAEWIKLAPLAQALGTLTAGDARAFELLCETLATCEAARSTVRAEGFTVATADGGKKPHPAVRIMEAAGNAAVRLLHGFGLIPSGRVALDLVPPSNLPTNPFLRHGMQNRPRDAFDEWRARKPPNTLDEFLAGDPDLRPPKATPSRARRVQ